MGRPRKPPILQACSASFNMSGLGPLAIMKGNEGAQIVTGTLAICVAGLAIGKAWFWSIAHKKPTTMTPQWKAATAKYRAAQIQDPISISRGQSASEWRRHKCGT